MPRDIVYTAQEIQQFSEKCVRTADLATDQTGFVPVFNLLKAFQVEISFRPLLVEAMLAEVQSADTGKRVLQVIVDSEKFPYSMADLESENSKRVLPARFRNTVAHELVHCLAFEPDEFGPKLKAKIKGLSLGAFVKAIESHTEKLSPLLLWSERALENLLGNREEPIPLKGLLQEMSRVGVSRYTLITRLQLTRESNNPEIRSLAGLRNLGIGIARMDKNHKAMIQGWPLYHNFDNGIMPTLFWKAPGTKEKLTPVSEFVQYDDFAMCGGKESVVVGELEAGTFGNQSSEFLRVEISSERDIKPGNEFLFVVRVPSYMKSSRPSGYVPANNKLPPVNWP